MPDHVATFAAILATLFAAHSFGDHWVQTHRQACTKALTGPDTGRGRRACTAHVVTLTATKAAMLAIVTLVTGLRLHPVTAATGLAVDAASHWWADRRWTLAELSRRLGKTPFYVLGAPRAGRDDNPNLGTGAYALDQSWHHFWLWVAALLIAA